ncbi:MAG: TonB-dependent receptor [Crocinitomicaceae bacterium]|nr:TonB-dependent receptor [Crocinitomicaceae bacterium]
MAIARALLILSGVVFVLNGWSQTIRGKVVDDNTGEPLFSVSVGEKGTTNGAITDFEGEFTLKVSGLPVVLVVRYIGYIERELQIEQVNQRITIKLSENTKVLKEVEVVEERISEKQKQAPLTVESMDLIAIKQAPSGNFYEALGSLKGVDLTTASLGFRIINTRGFNSTSPVRTLQLIDGVDNQSPGLNFSLGNFLGAPDLDVKSVDIIQGASSAFYGPGAFNGVISMETKNPFVFTGLSAQLRVGERNLVEPVVRWAQKFTNKEGHDNIAYKFNVYYLQARDWEAENYEPVYNSGYDKNNPGRFDAVNIYGDEFFPANNFSTTAPWNYKGVGTFFRTGYRERDLVNYNTRNLKANVAVHFRLKPEMEFESPELIIASNVGTGTTVYQGDNRFSLRDIFFFQNRIELKKKDKYFIRVYATNENAGKSYDPYFTALKMLGEARPNETWAKAYVKYWQDSINGRINNLGYPQLQLNPDWTPLDPIEEYYLPYNYQTLEQWKTTYHDSLMYWHSIVEQWANNGNAGIASIKPDGYFEPGSEKFAEAFNRITGLKNNQGSGGTRFYDRSALYHIHGEYQMEDRFFIQYRVGANARLYKPNSDGTIFYDTTTVITNYEVGVYFGTSRKFIEDKLIVNGTIRMDKNVNFDPVFSPAASLIFQPKKNHYLRASFSSALRNPTLTDQYLYLNVGPAILSGNLDGAQKLITLESFSSYRRTLNTDSLIYFDIDPIRPEQVKTFEVGYRGTISDKIYIDGGYYISAYRYFIGYNIGIDATFDSQTNLPLDMQVFRYSANSKNIVRTQGANIGLNYYIYRQHTINGNYSWNRIVKTDPDDPIIPAFNTPEHKFNVGISARDWMKKSNGNSWGYSINYKWIKGFLFEGSPQFTGFVPTYDLIDVQVNYSIFKAHTNFKLGCSNIANNKQFQTYGGPRIGRMAYFSIHYEFNAK